MIQIDFSKYLGPGFSPGTTKNTRSFGNKLQSGEVAELVEGDGLENRYICKGIEGSNPSLSANFHFL